MQDRSHLSGATCSMQHEPMFFQYSPVWAAIQKRSWLLVHGASGLAYSHLTFCANVTLWSRACMCCEIRIHHHGRCQFFSMQQTLQTAVCPSIDIEACHAICKALHRFTVHLQGELHSHTIAHMVFTKWLNSVSCIAVTWCRAFSQCRAVQAINMQR